jgi:predicted DNA-binding WGR domain protein
VFAIELQAVSPQAQHRRAYEIHVDQDLFSQLVVTIDFGVIGTRGQHRVHLVADIAEAQAVVCRALRRQLTGLHGRKQRLHFSAHCGFEPQDADVIDVVLIMCREVPVRAHAC